MAIDSTLPPFPTTSFVPDGTHVSIIISNHNYERYVVAAVESALAQREVAVEVIVVDNGSTDGSRRALARLADRVELILQPDRGQAGAFNAGFGVATGGLVMFLDADDLLYPDVARDVVRSFARHPGAGRAIFRLDVVDEHGTPLGELVPPAHSELPHGDVRKAVLSHPDDMPWPPTSGNAFAADVLQAILPLSETDEQVGADLHLHALTPLLAPVVALERAGGAYRLHDRNAHLRPGTDLERSRWLLGRSRDTHRALAEWSRRLGYVGPRPASVTLAVHRLVSLRADDGAHPVPDDTRRRILRSAVTAVAGRADLSPLAKAAYVGWFVITAAAPAALVPRLADYALGRGRGRGRGPRSA